MSSGPYINNISVWDLTYLETGGGSTVTGVVSMPGSGAASFTGSLIHKGTVALTGVGTATFTSSGIIAGDVSITGSGAATFAGFTFITEIVAEDLTVADTVLSQIAYQNFVTDVFKMEDFTWPTGDFKSLVSDSLTVDDAVLADIITYIYEAVTIDGTLDSSGVFQIYAIEGVSLDDKIYFGIPVSVLEDLTLDDSLINVKDLFSHLLSRVAVGDLPGDNVLFSTAVGEIFTLDDLPLSVEVLIEALTGDDTLATQLVAIVGNTDAIGLSGSLGDVLRAYLTTTGTIALDDANQTQQTHTLTEIIENMTVGTVYEDGDITGWVMNPENYAISNYTLGFTDTAVLDNQYLMADSTGLYAIDGSTDNGSDIVATVTTASLDLGSDSLKQVPQVLLGTNGTDVVLKVSVDGNNTAFYELANQPSEFHTKRIKVGKGLIGNNWQFTLITTNNSVLDLDSFEFYPIILKRNHNG